MPGLISRKTTKFSSFSDSSIPKWELISRNKKITDVINSADNVRLVKIRLRHIADDYDYLPLYG